LGHRSATGRREWRPACALFGGGRRFRVLDVVVFEEEDALPFVAMLRARPPSSASWRLALAEGA